MNDKKHLFIESNNSGPPKENKQTKELPSI